MITPLPPVLIRRATATDAAPLAHLGRRTFSEAFAAENSVDDLAQFLDSAYGPGLQADELADPALIYLVTERASAMIAFALLRTGRHNPSITDPTAVELQRFYVDAAHHGSGVARLLMAACVTQAQDLGAATLFLGVWERNARAIRFYEKEGFANVGAQTFRVGTDDQRDLVLARAITPSVPDSKN